MSYVWSQAALDLLLKLHVRQGLSAAETARAMGGGATRNAVLAKVQRMGWSRPRDAPPAPGIAASGAPRERGSRATRGPFGREIPLPVLRQIASPWEPRLWTERQAGECAFPVGDPPRPGLQLSCCAPTRGGAYCPAHKALMARPDSRLTDSEIAAIVEIARRAA